MHKIEKDKLTNDEFIAAHYTYVVVGASSDKSKYGHRVYRDILSAGWRVYPVNPRGGKLLGNKVYTSLQEIPEKIDVMVMVVPPQVSEKIVIQAKQLGIDKIWFQPGSESGKALEFCREQGIRYQTEACIMMERRS